MSQMNPTVLRCARTHNLQEISLELRPGEVVVLTGVSGSGKSSLAIDTLYAEGQRRFIESFSPYARQFLERLERPPMESLDPVAAGVAVDRRAPVKSSRSTVATLADLEPYLAALFLHESRPRCPNDGRLAEPYDVTRAVAQLREQAAGERLVVTYPVAVASVEGLLDLRENLIREGYRRVRVGQELQDVESLSTAAVLGAGGLEVVLDRVVVAPQSGERLRAAIELGWQRGAGLCHAHTTQHSLRLRRGLACPSCAQQFEPPAAGRFSYESPMGACPTCKGFGRTVGVDWQKVFPEPQLSLAKGAIRPWRGTSTQWERAELIKFCKRARIPMERPWRDLSPAQREQVLRGDGRWEDERFPGVAGWFAWLETRTYKMHVRVLLSRFRAYDECPQCHGHRLNESALAFQVDGANLADWHSSEVSAVLERVVAYRPTTEQGKLVCHELESRLAYLTAVGLGYLTLDRQARTLSGGEAQRVTLTAALGTSLHNALFVLDEPSVGLHPSDLPPLQEMLQALARRNNIVLVIEHEPRIIAAADRVLELGPAAGKNGGNLVAQGTPREVVATGGATARSFASQKREPSQRRQPSGWLRLRGLQAFAFSNFDVDVPLGVICALTGPSGSGKSTLAVDVIARAAERHLGVLDAEAPLPHRSLEGLEQLSNVVLVDQSPLGRTSRGNAATYTKAWDRIRVCYAAEPAAAAAGLTPASFSFNVEGGRCDTCAGEGAETVEMQFLADVRLTCPDCGGRRFKPEVCRVRHRGFGIAELLASTVDETLERFDADPAVRKALGPLQRLGLGYLTLGQPLSTLSGGEAQRMKLARALAEVKPGTLCILDEPSAGLHADEVARVTDALERLVLAGGSVLVVEHDVELIRAADHVLDLGPGAGRFGGQLLGAGTPEAIAKLKTKTAQAMRDSRGLVPSGKRGSASRRPDEPHQLRVEGAREHNLQNVSCKIPHGALTVVTGPSGSGKSSLAFNVIFAEGQRRFLETLTPYARQFLPTLPRPNVASVTGVPPAIALEQRLSRAGGSSTVATVTEVAQFLRLLFAKTGLPHCPVHGTPIQSLSRAELGDALRKTRGSFDLLAPVVRGRKGTYLDLFAAAAKAGIAEARCDGEWVSTDRPPRLAKSLEHEIELAIARDIRVSALDDALIERTLEWGKGEVRLLTSQGKLARDFSTRSACPDCGLSVAELDPRAFSFATKQGRCPDCEGTGSVEQKSRKRGSPETENRLCTSCQGSRLAPVARAVQVAGVTYPELTGMSVTQALAQVQSFRFTGRAAVIAESIVGELLRRLRFLLEVGLGYLSLDRPADTLSGGELQRLRIAAQLGAGLTGALYVLDEPTIGLHPRDTQRLLGNLRRLVDTGSTVVVVEHDIDTIRAADYLLDLGPGGGRLGGNLVASGTPAEVLKSKSSPTARALATPPPLRVPLACPARDAHLVLAGAKAHNLKNVTLRVPLGRLTVVAGVSGSGKSTLIRQVLLPAVREKLGLVAPTPLAHRSLSGLGNLKRAVAVDQSPIGRTPRSVPATFLGVWDQLRQLYASTNDAKANGFTATRFSFNSGQGGRCTTCTGQGVVTQEMSFLPDVVSECPSCAGQRFEPATLSVRHLDLSVGEVLSLTAEQALHVFENHPSIAAPLRTLTELGAGYIRLGQGSHTLSGGEAQRLKLAAELTPSSSHEPTLYVLDEPTTGLHLGDVHKLVEVLSQLVARGDTVVVIEHHPIVIAGADHIVEMGPEAGVDGGSIVAEGPPSEIAQAGTPTGLVVAEVLAEQVATGLASTPSKGGRGASQGRRRSR